MVRTTTLLLAGSATLAGAYFAPAGRVAAVTSRPAIAGARPAMARFASPPVKAANIVMDEAAAAEPEKDGIMETLTTGSFFALWYLFNIGYNIYNCLLYTSPSPRDS